jgi:hypothetical protein
MIGDPLLEIDPLFEIADPPQMRAETYTRQG